MSKELAASGQLSAAQLTQIKFRILRGEGYTDDEILTVFDMALLSLRGTFADGIEAVLSDAELHLSERQRSRIRALAQGQRTSEQAADELLREVLDWGLPDDLKQRIDAHLSLKGQK